MENVSRSILIIVQFSILRVFVSIVKKVISLILMLWDVLKSLNMDLLLIVNLILLIIFVINVKVDIIFNMIILVLKSLILLVIVKFIELQNYVNFVLIVINFLLISKLVKNLLKFPIVFLILNCNVNNVNLDTKSTLIIISEFYSVSKIPML